MEIFWILSLCFVSIFGREGFGPTDQEWGYVTVRRGAHIFWWLHYTTAKVDNYTDRPLVVWLQGGPGASSTGFGNFAEIGPLDADLQRRNTSWDKDMNVLFVDNPVGTGFSYVDEPWNLATTNRQIADDFLALLNGFYTSLPQFKDVPLYIFSESYGGKMAAEIALRLHEASQNGNFEGNLLGIGLGDSWISPIDCVLAWPSFLFNVGAIDGNGYKIIQQNVNRTQQLINQGQWKNATSMFFTTERVITKEAGHIDFYNILERVPKLKVIKKVEQRVFHPDSIDEIDNKIEILMNGKVKEALGIDQEWARDKFLFSTLTEDFMKPVTDIVESLLNNTDIKVAVYTGQLDLIVNTPGTMAWLDRLNFVNLDEWNNTPRYTLEVDGYIEGFVKQSGNLFVYTVYRAGHMVPLDNPSAMKHILSQVTNNFSSK